ncbi:MAG: hypothetical protein EA409_00365 [Saprospirales bacterium]|nr:MAG: hypothetical protein EA409_00365 [Saprospirales bacterium]
MVKKPINYIIIIILTAMGLITFTGCTWHGRYYIKNTGPSEILLVNYRIQERHIDQYCFIYKMDSIQYDSKNQCFKMVEFQPMADGSGHSLVIPTDHILFMGRGPFPHLRSNWVVQDPDSGDEIDNLNDLRKWKVYPIKPFRFRRVFLYEVDGKESEKERGKSDP